jgi:hypothetical protein
MTMQGDDDLYGALTLLPSAHYHLPEGAISPWSPIGYIDQDIAIPALRYGCRPGRAWLAAPLISDS